MPDKKQIRDHRSGITVRFPSMDGAELADRIRQELQKRGDAILFGLGIDPSRGEVRPAEGGSRRFFFRSEDLPRWMDLLRERMPQHVKTILKRAEKICRHQFRPAGLRRSGLRPGNRLAFGSRAWETGTPRSVVQDPVSGFRFGGGCESHVGAEPSSASGNVSQGLSAGQRPPVCLRTD